MFQSLDYGITGRAKKLGLINVDLWNPREFTKDKHKTVDDRPYGGGPGMVMMVEPLREAIKAAKTALGKNTKVIYLSPQGRTLDQGGVFELANRPELILVSARYEGVDERLLMTEVDEEWSIGDYILSGGELAAMVLIDALTRVIPGALGDDASAQQDSFVNNLLDYPHYTRPETVADLEVPAVLLSGDHQAIAKWRLKQSLGRTWLRRPDLLVDYTLTAEQQILLDEFIREHNEQ